VDRIASALPGLALLVCSGPAPLADRVRGLRDGADDWVAKPCHPDELVARIQAVLRRRRTGDAPIHADAIAAGELAIRPDRFDAYVGGQSASLSRREYELLHQLALADGRVLEREEIYQRVWGYTMVRGYRSVDVFVRKLRHKLERLSPRWRYVAWIASVTYRQRRAELYSLGDARRAALYAAAAVATLTLTATSRLWHTSAGSVAWLVLLGGAAYTAFAVLWAARKY